AFAGGVELRGKTLGFIGIGRIGQETAKIGLAVGMKVIAYDPFIEKVAIKLSFFDGQSVDFQIETISKEEVLKQADFISLHVPAKKEYVLGKKEFELMKDGIAVMNAARGGVIDEAALIGALDSGKLSF